MNKNNLFYLKIILILCCLHFSVSAQKKIEFEITFGNYTNDHATRKFYSQERKWILKKEKLIYFIDAHDKRYSDTLKLKTNEVDSLIKIINENKLSVSVKKDLSDKTFDKYEWTGNIIGHLNLNGKVAHLNIKANSMSVLDKDADVKRLKKLEELLYKIIESHRQ